MSKTLYIFIIILLTAICTIIACKKETQPEKSSVNTAIDEMAVPVENAGDEVRVNTEQENIFAEINDILNLTSGKNGIGIFKRTVVCGAGIDTSSNFPGVIMIKYNGNIACRFNTVKRSGYIQIQLVEGNKWETPGVTAFLTFINYTSTSLTNGKTISINGTQTITNVLGGRIGDDTGNNTVVYKIRAGKLRITFDNGIERTWSIAKKVILKLNHNKTYITRIGGDTSIGRYSDVALWGVLRSGEEFMTRIPQPVIANNFCGLHRPLTGVRIIAGSGNEITETFGVNAAGDTDTSACPYGYKISAFNHANEIKTRVIKY